MLQILEKKPENAKKEEEEEEVRFGFVIDKNEQSKRRMHHPGNLSNWF